MSHMSSLVLVVIVLLALFCMILNLIYWILLLLAAIVALFYMILNLKYWILLLLWTTAIILYKVQQFQRFRYSVPVQQDTECTTSNTELIVTTNTRSWTTAASSQAQEENEFVYLVQDIQESEDIPDKTLFIILS